MRFFFIVIGFLGIHSLSAAQQFTVAIAELRGAGSDTDRTEQADIVRGFNVADCADADAAVVLRLGGQIPAALELWHNNGNTSNDCSTTEGRVDPTMNASTGCVYLDQLSMNGNEAIFPLATIKNGDSRSGASKGENVCTDNRVDYIFYLIPSSGGDPNMGEISAFQTFPLSIDGAAPPAPTFDVDQLEGNRFSVGWNAVTDGPDQATLIRYVVEINDEECGFANSGVDAAVVTDAAIAVDAAINEEDAATEADAATESDAAINEEDAATEADAGASTKEVGRSSAALIRSFETDPGQAEYTVDLESYGVEEGGKVGLRVAAMDRAGNQGAWSDSICITRVTGSGPCDFVEGGCKDNCSINATTSHGSTSTIALMAVFALFLIRRRWT